MKHSITPLLNKYYFSNCYRKKIIFLFWLMSQDFIRTLGDEVLKNKCHSP